MNEGRIEQVGHPLEIYRKPISAFVASFFGEVNFIEGKIAPFGEPAAHVPVEVLAHGKSQILFASPQPGMNAGDRVYVCIRPQDIELVSDTFDIAGTPAIRGKISRIVHMGSHVEYYVDVGEMKFSCHSVQDLGSPPGTTVTAMLKPERCICVGR
jgi:ABC-type Fe3+/spermidine/putrescine transport system ATPase subunit